MRHLSIALIFLPIVLLCQAAPFIVQDGQPRADIVIAPDAVPVVQLAARDLQAHVQKMSGAELPIAHSPDAALPVHIYVGKSSYTDKLGIQVDDLRHGAFRLVSGEDSLVLIGRDRLWQPGELMKLAADKDAWSPPEGQSTFDHPLWKQWDAKTGEYWNLPFSQLWKQHNTELDLWEMDERGTFNAVAEFLRREGVRWYTPGDLGTLIPEKTTIALPRVDETVRPDFELRYPYLYGMRFSRGGDNMMWQLHMGFNQAPDIFGEGYCAHGTALVIGREETKKAHPEYYALMGGRRVTEDRFAHNGRPCLSSPELIATAARFVRALYDNFDMPVVSVMPTDGFTSICQCELCQGKAQPERGWRGQFSNYVWEYCNAVAKEVYKTHPDRKVVGLAYTTYMDPPTSIDQLSPNLLVGIAQGRASFGQNEVTRQYVQNLRKAWLAKMPGDGKNLYEYEYYRYGVPGKNHEFMPAFFPHAIADDLRSLKGVSLGDYIEVHTGRSRPVTFLNVYVTGRYWWDTTQDIDAMLDEYYQLFYGPAEQEMKAFIDYSEHNWMDLRKVDKIDRVFELLAAAQAKAPKDSVYATRINLLADYIAPLADLRTQLSMPRDNVPRAVLVSRDETELTLDGKLDEPFWQTLRTYFLRDIKTGKPETKNGTRFHLFWSKDSLYMGITCQDPDMANLNITATRDDDPGVWSGDEVEILIETQVHAYYQLCISPTGALLDADHKNGFRTIWSSDAEVATHRGEDGWSIEIRIPVASEDQENIDPNNGLAGRMPSNSYPWYFNVCRQRARGDSLEHYAFSPTGEGFQKPRKFGELGGIIRDPKERERRRKLQEAWLKQFEVHENQDQ